MVQITLAAARVNKGLTQQEAADLCGISKATLSLWERGVIKPTEIQVRGLASLYDIPHECIFLPEELPKS